VLAPWCPPGARRRQSVRLLRRHPRGRRVRNRSGDDHFPVTIASIILSSITDAIDFAAIITYSGGAQRFSWIVHTFSAFERSWTQQRPVTLDGKTLDVPGRIITGNTVVDGIDLAAALNRKRH
jgi:hypothetical protein